MNLRRMNVIGFYGYATEYSDGRAVNIVRAYTDDWRVYVRDVNGNLSRIGKNRKFTYNTAVRYARKFGEILQGV